MTQVGSSAVAGVNGKIVTQENYSLRCRGADAVGYCVSNLAEGSMVHVVSKLVQKPRYVAIHGTYEENTELLVSASFGSIVKVASL